MNEIGEQKLKENASLIASAKQMALDKKAELEK